MHAGAVNIILAVVPDQHGRIVARFLGTPAIQWSVRHGRGTQQL